MNLRSLFAKPKDAPKGLTVELSSHCGYDCAPCPLNFYTEGVRRQHADAARLLEVFRESAPLGVIDFTGWGEGLLHPELISLVSAAARAAKEVTLTTAGSLLSEEKSRGLLGAGLSYLMVSLDAATAETYSKLKHKDEFDLVVENVRRFLALRGRGGPRVALSFIVMRENLAEAASFARLSAQLGVDQIVFKTLVPFAREELTRSVDSHYYAGLPEGLAARARGEVLEAAALAAGAGVEVAWFGDFETAGRHPCMAYAEERPFLRADGALSPCCMAAYPVQRISKAGEARNQAPVVLGSFAAKSVGELWRQGPHRDFRRSLSDPRAPLPAACRDCPVCENFAMRVFPAGARIVSGKAPSDRAALTPGPSPKVGRGVPGRAG